LVINPALGFIIQNTVGVIYLLKLRYQPTLNGLDSMCPQLINIIQTDHHASYQHQHIELRQVSTEDTWHALAVTRFI